MNYGRIIKRSAFVLAIVLTLVIVSAWYLLYVPESPPPPGPIESRTIQIGDRARTYLVFFPSQLEEGARVLFALHPSQSRGGAMRRIVGPVFESLAERDNVVIVYPNGYEGHFNDCRRIASFSARRFNVDDIRFIKQIIEQLVAEKRVDRERVYAIGYSNGGHMALRLALETPQIVQGVASIAANLPTPENMDCQVSSSPSRYIVFVEGTKDLINPYKGGRVTLFGFGNRGSVLSAQESADWFARKLRLTRLEPKCLDRIEGIGARQDDWGSSAGYVRLITIDGGGHTVPQTHHRFPRILGATYRSTALLESIWQLFKRVSFDPSVSSGPVVR